MWCQCSFLVRVRSFFFVHSFLWKSRSIYFSRKWKFRADNCCLQNTTISIETATKIGNSCYADCEKAQRKPCQQIQINDRKFVYRLALRCNLKLSRQNLHTIGTSPATKTKRGTNQIKCIAILRAVIRRATYMPARHLLSMMKWREPNCNNSERAFSTTLRKMI